MWNKMQFSKGIGAQRQQCAANQPKAEKREEARHTDRNDNDDRDAGETRKSNKKKDKKPSDSLPVNNTPPSRPRSGRLTSSNDLSGWDA